MIADLRHWLIGGRYSHDIGLAGLGAILFVPAAVEYKDLLVHKVGARNSVPVRYASRRSINYLTEVAIEGVALVVCGGVMLCGLVGAAGQALGHPEYDLLAR